MINNPEAAKLLAQLSPTEQQRVGIVLEAIRYFPTAEPISVFGGGNVRRGAISHHILLAVLSPEEVAQQLFDHVDNSLNKANLIHEVDPRSRILAEPHFLGAREQSLSGRPIYVAVGPTDIHARREILTQLYP